MKVGEHPGPDTTVASSRSAGRDTAAEDELNEQFHALLRDAADQREGRAQTNRQADTAAAAEESTALFRLARGVRRAPRGPHAERPTGSSNRSAGVEPASE